MKKIRLGVVGACGRGASFKAACDAHPAVEVVAVCDLNKEGLPKAADKLGARLQFTDYNKMIEADEVDAVIVGTPMPLHVPQSIAALRLGKHVLCEVPAAVNFEESRELVLAARASSGIYMMAENYIYGRPIQVVGEIVRQGLLGTLYFGEAEYIHELKDLQVKTPWRRKWGSGINGNTYPTHSLGPILHWMHGDRVQSVCCAGSGHHYPDAEGKPFENEDSTLTLCRMRSGGLVKLRLDMLSERPHSMTNYQIQGTDGCFESARAKGEPDRIWLRSRNKGKDIWTDLRELEEEFLPKSWREHGAAAKAAGHGGGDFFEIMDFVDACLGLRPPAIDIDLAMDMTLPGLASQQSIREGSSWVDVPNSRDWK